MAANYVNHTQTNIELIITNLVITDNVNTAFST